MVKKLSALLLVLVVVLALPVSVSANAAEPPGMIIIVEGAPGDIELTLELAEAPEFGIRIHRSDKKWETYFRLFYSPDIELLNGAAIRVESSEKSFTCPLSQVSGLRYNQLMTLNYQDETLTVGQRWWRQPVLTAIRMTLTLLVEGLIFLAFGFRHKRSWIVFFVVNLITQGWLNYIINSGAFGSGYWVLGLYLAEFVIFIAESIAFPVATKEKKKWVCVLYVLTANAASLAVGMLLISHLPV